MQQEWLRWPSDCTVSFGLDIPRIISFVPKPITSQLAPTI